MFSIYRRYKFTREAVCSYRAISTGIRAQSREDPEGHPCAAMINAAPSELRASVIR